MGCRYLLAISVSLWVSVYSEPFLMLKLRHLGFIVCTGHQAVSRHVTPFCVLPFCFLENVLGRMSQGSLSSKFLPSLHPPTSQHHWDGRREVVARRVVGWALKLSPPLLETSYSGRVHGGSPRTLQESHVGALVSTAIKTLDM